MDPNEKGGICFIMYQMFNFIFKFIDTDAFAVGRIHYFYAWICAFGSGSHFGQPRYEVKFSCAYGSGLCFGQTW